MIFFVYPSKDTTIYKHKDLRLLNTGRDEILEVSNFKDEMTGHHIARSLIQFDLGEIIENKEKLIDVKYYLNLKITESLELARGGRLYVYSLSEAWDEGVGRWSDTELNYKGASWSSRDVYDMPWTIASDSTGGGHWNETPVNFFEFEGMFSDVKIDVTTSVTNWVDGTTPNNGFILMFAKDNTNHLGTLKFFSKDTNTIYSPYLEVAYKDYYFNPCSCYEVDVLSCGNEVLPPTPTPTPTPTPEVSP